jgi:hypothetical protein
MARMAGHLLRRQKPNRNMLGRDRRLSNFLQRGHVDGGAIRHIGLQQALPGHVDLLEFLPAFEHPMNKFSGG